MKKADICAWKFACYSVEQQGWIENRAVCPEHFSLFNTGWWIIWILQNGDGLLLTIFLFLWERVNGPQSARLKWYRVAVKQDAAEPAAARN